MILSALLLQCYSVVLAGDINIRLERSTDPHTVEFYDLLASYGLGVVRGYLT